MRQAIYKFIERINKVFLYIVAFLVFGTVASAFADVMSRLLGEVVFDGERLKRATEKGFLAATDLADYLVRKGVTFREAHEMVGQLVLFALDQGKELHELTLAEIQRYAKKVGKDVYEWLDPAMTVKRRNLPGGTGPEMVKQRLKQVGEELAS